MIDRRCFVGAAAATAAAATAFMPNLIVRPARAQAARDAGGPPARPKSPANAYDATIYDQGALALEALRREVGDATFRAIEAEWLDAYRDSSASTDDFVHLASEVAGRDLGPFLDGWLRAQDVPPFPADPDASPSPTTILPTDGTPRPSAGEE